MPEPFRRAPQGPAANPLGLPFIELQSVDSTNNYARQQIHAGLAQHGMTVFAHEQLAGKGQRGRSWTSEKGANIMMSLILEEPGLELTDQFHLSACISVAVQDFFSKYAGHQTTIKWPNDLYWQDRKAGGLLIENVIGSASAERGTRKSDEENRNAERGARKSFEIQIWKWAIVGVGININQTNFPGDLRNPVSLKQITGKDFDPVHLAKELVLSIQNGYDELLENGFEKIFDLYNQNLYKKDQCVRLKKENKIFEAVMKSVSKTGKLIIQHAFEEEFDFGEVEWLI